MYNITLEINQRCNLRCKYCYLGDKNEKKMTYDTGCKALDIAFSEIKKHKDHKLSISFIGGEPLLDFQLIKDLVEYCDKKNESLKYEIGYSITTNATITSEEIADFLCDKNFMIKISIDGEKTVNDINRVNISGGSVYDKILENLPFFKDVQNRSNYLVQVTNVITGNNYSHYFDSLKYLTHNLGLKAIDTAVDVSYDWTEEQIKVIEEEVQKSFVYFAESIFKGEGFEWSLFQVLADMEKKPVKFFSCGAGVINSYVRTDGSILPCSGYLDKSVEIGNVNDGLNKEKVDFYKKIESIENEKCKKCELYDICPEKTCVLQNLAICNDMNTPIPVMCARRKFLYKLYKENIDIIKQINQKMTNSKD